MGTKGKEQITIDLEQFKMHVRLRGKIEVSLHFDSPSRRFYLSVIALMVHEMHRLGRVTSIPLSEHQELLTLLNETVGGSAGSSGKETLLPRIYKKWKSALPDLENAPLFRVLGKTKEFGEASGKTYNFTDEEKDFWANLFEYKGSGENVRLRFSLDKLGVGLDDIVVVYGEEADQKAADGWERFLEMLKRDNLQEQVKEAVPEKSPGETPSIPVGPRKWTVVHLRDLKVAVPVLAAFFVVIVILWRLYSGTPTMEPASVNKMAFPLPDKPSIAVLPFVNMSDDPAQDHLCDGITEEIITALSKCPFMFVIARNSTFTYKGKPVKVQQIAEDLGVRYVMEGSVRKAGERMRIAVQLNDAITGTHLWGERYEGQFGELFALEDEISLNVLSALKIRFTEGSGAQIRSKGTKNLDAYLKYLESRALLMQGSPSGFSACRRAAEESIARDPDFTGGYRMLAWVYLSEYEAGIGKSPSESLATAFELAQKICEMDQFDPLNYCILAMVYLHKEDREKALTTIRKAIQLDPNSSTALYFLNQILTWGGDDLEAIQVAQKAIRLNPLDNRFLAQCFHRLGRGYARLGLYEEAITEYEKSLRIRPDGWGTLLYLAAAYALVGREEDARMKARELLRVHPTFTIASFEKAFPYQNQELKEREFAAFRKAGLK